MSEVLLPPESKEKFKSYPVTARNLRGEETNVGTFNLDEEGKIEFMPNIELDPASQTMILEPTFQGEVTERMKKGRRIYELNFTSDKDHLSQYMIFGDKRRRDGKEVLEIYAHKGALGDVYWNWELSEDQWRQMDEWLQANLNKAEIE